MNAQPPHSGLQFLSVAEAAETLGVSRMRIRDAAARGLIPSQRDNENKLRLDISALRPGALEREGDTPDRGALMNLLFDEIEELNEALGDSRDALDALSHVADRQADALDAAADRMERDAAEKARLTDLLDRALSHLEMAERESDTSAETARMAAVSDRALTALEQTGARLELALDQNARFDALMERALDHASRSATGSADDTAAMGATAERAMRMLEQAMGGAEASQQTARRTGEMLDRALQAGERLEAQIDARDREIADKTATVEKVLTMSERAVALAAPDRPSPRRGFWQWLMGRR